MSDLLSNLNPKQQEAVKATHGPVLVIAGAGSGKTKALTNRIAYMIEEEHVSPWNILAVTFTNKAANEMKERIVKLLKKDAPLAFSEYSSQGSGSRDLPSVGTFHSTCVRILRQNIHLLNYENQFVIYDTADQQILVKQIMKDLQIDEKQTNPRAVLNFISSAKNQLIGPTQYHQFANNYFTERVAEVYEKYQKALHKNNALDFDDIIMKTVQLFQSEPKVLDHYQEKFRFISVDEYQDTNEAQYILTNMLAKKYRNLCVIGDSDQSIYSFRGANIGNILNFEKDYPDAKVVKLEQNYRSTQTILDAAHGIIVKNAKRKDKKLWTQREGGEKIKLVSVDNERQEGEFVAREIMDRLRAYETPDYRDFVILYRTNAQSRVLEEVFLRYAIPYKIVGGIKFYERKEVKDIIAYLRVIQNPSDSVSMMRIINTPTRKIGTKSIEQLRHYAQIHNLTLFEAMEQVGNNRQEVENGMLDSGDFDLQDSKIESIQRFAKVIRDLQQINREFSASGVIKHVLEYTGYKQMIDDNTADGDARVENIYELVGVSSKYDKLEPGTSLSIFLEEVALIADVDSMSTQDNAVTFMTIHSAKGLEFPNVFLVGLEEGIFPHSRSLLERDELEEERRLMYVAITRAKDKLYLLNAKNRMLYGESHANAASQFLADIPAELFEDVQPQRRILRREEISGTPIPMEGVVEGIAEGNLANAGGFSNASDGPRFVPDEDFADSSNPESYSDGDKVYHNSFGEGVVVTVTGGVATVRFKNARYGIKKLALSIAPLRKM
ncbi:MAG: UvrD-helicase domain-containing protein [Candidatus Gracilibacteria bacterium]|jgi:DNA helicase-2/ATP-dependent DNA helicase PcrA